MRGFRLAVLAACGLSAVLLIFATAAAGQGEHGLAGSTICQSPTKVGDPVFCTYTIRNTSDDFGDTMRAHLVIATAQSPGGTVPSGNIFNSLAWVFLGGTVTCTGGSGAGTIVSPYINATSCDISDGARISSLPFSFYTAQPIDATVPLIPMLADYAATDLCDKADPATDNCPVNDLTVGVNSQTQVIKRNSGTETTIHNAAHGAVTVVERGATVHDFVQVSSADGGPVPTGNLNIDWFTNSGCTGSPANNSGSIGPLNGAGQFDATGFPQGPLAPGFYGFLAHYEGSGTYNGSTGLCEPLQVVDANIQLTPATATNAVGTNHVLTCHINVNDGNGQVNAPDGTVCTVAIISGPGTPTTQNCTVGNPTPGSGSCNVTITSAATGTSLLRASTNVNVAGLVLHRETGDGLPGDGIDAQKVWVDANIQITPPTATNAVGTNHVLTITVNALGGTIDAGPHTATASIVSGPGSFVGSPTCTYTGGGATASCTVTISSTATGTTVVQATSNIPVNGQTIPRTTATNPGPGGSGNASKVWVDANIQITPPTATNAVGTNHVLTITVNALGGTIDAGPHTATASILSGPGSFVGSPTCTYTGGGATASCTVTISSTATGTTVISATSNIPVNGQTISRTTATNPGPGGSGNAQKTWVDANIQITPANATNATGTNHVLTITVNALGGTIDAGPHTATASILSGPGTFVGSPSCTYTGGGATASCTVTITSTTTGTTVVQATSNIPVNGQTITRTTGTAANTASGGSGNASKVWVDAWIDISPANANNPVTTNHVLTITVHALGGTLGNGSATASIQSGPGSFVGSPTCNYTGGGTSASCQVTITSAAAGTTVVQATSNIPVSGQSITRTTGTAANTALCQAQAPATCANANKNWADVQNETHVRDAANNDVTGATLTAGTVVHDDAVVTKTAGTPASVPAPTGTVTFTLFPGGTCTGNAVTSFANVSLNAAGLAVSGTFTTPAVDGQFSFLAHYSGDANYPAKDAACEPFTVETPGGQITPTNVDCGDILAGTAPTLDAVNYPSSGGKIGMGINPGVFFYWTKITTTVPNQVVTTFQSNTSTNNSALFKIHQGWARLYAGDCSSWTRMNLSANLTTASITVPTPGNYIIGIKYDVKSLAGTNVPVPDDITFNFTTSLGASTDAAVLLKKKN